MSGIQNDHLRSYSGLRPEIRREMKRGDVGGGGGCPQCCSRSLKEGLQLQYLIRMKTIGILS